MTISYFPKILNVLKNGYLSFPKLLDFDSQNLKLLVLRNEHLKIFLAFPKNGMYGIELDTNNRCTQFQANIFV